eukprot:256202-Prymnesium_polylepis.2
MRVLVSLQADSRHGEDRDEEDEEASHDAVSAAEGRRVSSRDARRSRIKSRSAPVVVRRKGSRVSPVPGKHHTAQESRGHRGEGEIEASPTGVKAR